MNQSDLVDKVAQAAALNQVAAGQAVKAVVKAILDALLDGEAVRVSGLGTFNVAARPARQGRNPQVERPSKSQLARQCASTPAKPSKMPSIRQVRRRLPARSLHHQRNPRCGSKRSLDREGRPASALAIPRGTSSGISCDPGDSSKPGVSEPPMRGRGHVSGRRPTRY
jgi:DNA-binding protein HU-beta